MTGRRPTAKDGTGHAAMANPGRGRRAATSGEPVTSTTSTAGRGVWQPATARSATVTWSSR
ncbi:hypothetical protein [Amycolatopsis vancoresmycina]|uniref:hypothetical protein n=1 Tax=Amycolatopsis vancoresmycina TaxID=208444 RepID=UPI0003A9D4D8|nr:hypothetical protein [Amycolatopsis vancoresmycina]